MAASSGACNNEPKEMVSCGKCGTINTVPFGLEKFKCYNCGAMVTISREPSAACCAASSTAIYYEGLQAASGGGGGARSSTATAEPPRKTEGSSSSGGFFGKLQKTMGSTMQKVEKTFEGLTTGGVTNSTTGSSAKPDSEGSPLQAGLSSDTSVPDSEEEQLQRALMASLAEASGPAGQTPAATTAATTGPSRLRDVEERATRAERELAAVRAHEAQVAADRASLQLQLDETEGVIRNLTGELDQVNAQLSQKKVQCEALEKALLTAREAAKVVAVAPEVVSEQDHQGTVAQLLSRIADLESELLRATHFATPASQAPPATPGASAAVAQEREAIPASALPPFEPPARRSSPVAAKATAPVVSTDAIQLAVPALGLSKEEEAAAVAEEVRMVAEEAGRDALAGPASEEEQMQWALRDSMPAEEPEKEATTTDVPAEPATAKQVLAADDDGQTVANAAAAPVVEATPTPTEAPAVASVTEPAAEQQDSEATLNPAEAPAVASAAEVPTAEQEGSEAGKQQHEDATASVAAPVETSAAVAPAPDAITGPALPEAAETAAVEPASAAPTAQLDVAEDDL